MGMAAKRNQMQHLIHSCSVGGQDRNGAEGVGATPPDRKQAQFCSPGADQAIVVFRFRWLADWRRRLARNGPERWICRHGAVFE